MLILEGGTEKAINLLEKATRRFELSWETRYDPIFATLNDHPRFVALYDSIDRDIDALGHELGMPPAFL